MLKAILRKLIFPASLVAVLGLIALYILMSGESRKASFGDYTPERAEAFFSELAFENGKPGGEQMKNGNTTWYQVSENSNAGSLWFEPERGLIAVQDQNGKMWYGNPTDEALAADEVKGLWRSNLMSPFMFRYLKEKSTLPELTNTIDHKAKVQWRKIDNGVGVRYSIEDLGFSFYFEYQLNDEGLQFHMPELGILEEKENQIVTVEPLPFFGAATAGEEGYLFVPDGPGGLIHFNKDRPAIVGAYDQPVYGDDEAIFPIGMWFPRDSIAFPVYGLKRQDSAFVAIIEKGEFKANIYASPAGLQTAFNHVYSKFNLRRPYRQPTGLNKSVDAYESKLTVEPIQIRYELLGQEQADYVGMAKTYREYLENKVGAAKLESKTGKPPLFLDFIMAATEPGPVGDKTVVATTFDQVGGIADKLHEKGITNLEIGVGGWMPGGFQGSLPKRFPIESAVGGVDGLKKLAAELKEKGNRLIMHDTYTQATNKVGNGFSPLNDAARLVDGTAIKWENAGDWFSQTSYFYRPSALNMKSEFDDALKTYEKLPVDGISLDELGEVIYSDFSKSEPYDRKMTAEVYKQMLDDARKTAGYVSTTGAFSYILGHVDHIQSLPTVYNYDLIIDEQVPFYPIALHGLVTYTSVAGNIRTNPVTEYLRTIEYGAMPYFAVTDADPRDLKLTNYVYLFSSKFDALESSIVKEYEALSTALDGVWGSFIENHRKIADGVFETTYENGRRIWVNYNAAPYTSEGHTVNAQSFEVVEQGVSR
ncbi:DUF5696 domain-containing protein [Paenibacillus mendelii]|uniref:DUF5696 domain-containing protein n=1 Tax=Paenibacillus mendelii TaxID=206163 RepID=A0ABV6J7M7_9BACL|nr:DUF5696 domain-containing protein [Paenibacillus mendelii]MCQ6562130.1 DUF5696 domain-containing protein [Paenibacillus mendelii]